MSLQIGFIGGGAMAEAMIGGLLTKGVAAKESMIVSEPVAARRQYIEETFQVKTTGDSIEVLDGCDVVVIAVKPQVLERVLGDLQAGSSRELSAKCLFLSIVAGKPLATYAQYLPGARFARVMPNTPSLVGEGASVFVTNELCTDEDACMVETVMGACGIVERVADEKLIDAVTGLSGSGPAYVYLLIEAMSDGGVRMGLPRPTATRLAAQTVMGAGKMVLATGKHTGELKDMVTSPGGTTIAGVHALESGAFRGTVMNAVEAAATRSAELGKP